jgi:protein O-GlcNAc transferase
MDYSVLIHELPALYQKRGEGNIHPVSQMLETVAKQVVGTTTPNALQLLNLAVSLLEPGEVYCELGCFQGRSLIASLLGHPDQMAYAVDSFAEMNVQNQNSEKLAANLAEFNLSDQVFLCTQSFEEFFAELATLETEDKIGVFFYDAAQDYRSQLLALLLVKPFLADQAVLIINGSNHEFTRQAILDFLVTTPEADSLLDLQDFKHETYPFLDGVYVLAWDRQQVHPKDWSTLKGENSKVAIAKIRQATTADQQELLEKLLTEAHILQESNDNSSATGKYQQYLLWQPENFSAWLNLGVSFLRQQDYFQAIETFSHAQTLDQSNALVHFNLGIAFENCNDLRHACLAYQQAIALDPQLAQASHNLGAILLRQGEPAQAEAIFRQSTIHSPDDFASHFNLGHALLAQTKIDEAIAAYETAHRFQPEIVQSHLDKAVAAQALPLDLYLECGQLASDNGKYPEAATYFQKVLKIEDGHPQASNSLAECYKSMHQEIEAIATLEHSLQLHPNVSNQVALALILRYFGHTNRAIALVEQSLEAFPNSLALRTEQLLLIPLLYETHAELLEYRQAYAQGFQTLLQELPERIATETATQMLEIDLVLHMSESNQFFFAYQGFNDIDTQLQNGTLVQQLMRQKFADFMQPRALPPVGDKIRIGYLAETMKTATLGELYIGWLRHRSHQDFEIYCYHTGGTFDYLTQEFSNLSDHFYHIPRDVQAVCQQVTADQLHILVFPGIGLDTQTLMLAGLRLAPIQCTSWCHPVTTGLLSIDYFLSCESMETPEAQSHYSEQLVCLPKIGIAFPKPDIPASTKTRADFSIPEEAIVYLSCQTAYKYQPQYDFVYPEIAQQVKQSKFVFLSHPSQGIRQKFQNRLQNCFAEYGLNSEDYCIFLPRMPEQDYLAVNQAADIFLDTFGWSGGVTTLKAIACDLPIVTCPGEMMRSRHSWGIMQTLGVTDILAQTTQEYIDIAIRLGLDPDWRVSVVTQMRLRHDQLYDDKSCVFALEDFYRFVVKKN